MRTLFLAAALTVAPTLQVFASQSSGWTCAPDDGAPFGRSTEKDAANLVSFAGESGIDLLKTLDKVYAGDTAALAAVLQISTKFKSLDVPARTYGNMIYSIFLNLGERKGTDGFLTVLFHQDAQTQQKVRDILWHRSCVYLRQSGPRLNAYHAKSFPSFGRPTSRSVKMTRCSTRRPTERLERTRRRICRHQVCFLTVAAKCRLVRRAAEPQRRWATTRSR